MSLDTSDALHSHDKMNKIVGVTALTASGNGDAPHLIDKFNQLMTFPAQQGEGSSGLSPENMLVQQANVAHFVVGVDLCAKYMGGISQSVNKLVNMA